MIGSAEMTGSGSELSSVQRIRFGMMIGESGLLAWQREVIENLLAVDGVELALLIVDATKRRSPTLRLSRKLNPVRVLMGATYRVARLAGSFPASLVPVDLPLDLSKTQRIDCVVQRKGRYTELFQPSDVSGIEHQRLDFIIRFAFGIIRGEILQVAKWGVWSFHHGDPERYRGSPFAFWEIYNGEPETGAILQRLTEKLDAGSILKSGHVPTNGRSMFANQEAVVRMSVTWPADICRALADGEDISNLTTDVMSPAKIYRLPSFAQLIRFYATIARNNGAAWLRSVTGRLGRGSATG